MSGIAPENEARLRDLAEETVAACLPLLPLQGSDDEGYEPIPGFAEPQLVALPEEWASAAQAVAELHKALRS